MSNLIVESLYENYKLDEARNPENNESYKRKRLKEDAYNTQVKAHIHSLGGDMDYVDIVEYHGYNDVIARYKGKLYTAVFNPFADAFYVDDKYGYIIRYPEGKTNETGYIYEPWHIRYVGKELASKLYNDGTWLTMEDYFGITSKYDD